MVVKAIYSGYNYIFRLKRNKEYICLWLRTKCAIFICAFSPFGIKNNCRSPPQSICSKNKLIGGNNSEI